MDTSNLLHLKGIFQCASEHSCCSAFCKSCRKLEVDLILNDGDTWVKVISRNAKGLAMDFVTSGRSSNRSIVDQAHCYKIAAANYPHFYKPPEIIFHCLNGVPDIIVNELISCGVRVIGTVIPIGELVVLPEDWDSDSYSSDSCSSEVLELEKRESSVLNLDITAVFALISALTHGDGAKFHFASSMLNDQARSERKSPVLPRLMKMMEGKKVIICRTAYDAVNNILSTVAGPEEMRRAEELFTRVEVVEDKLSERAKALKMSDKINERSKVIFGSGDYYKAVTLTANRHFVNAAAYQGLRFAVVLHDSRALSEQKQLLADPL
ncbi:unnamed protein product [Enterobius vermicularis]|uniref:DUF1308 domain-containing protein n=1 Tax=Enterobius vermicularis TaxID=51028 RepID=A0A0N4VAK8_ENTVE|nr:unnamed protein product [Enterobius vermicularis]